MTPHGKPPLSVVPPAGPDPDLAPDLHALVLTDDGTARVLLLARTAIRLLSLSGLDRFSAFAEAVITSGGTLILPEPANSWSAQTCVLSLWGVTGSDADPAVAIAEWLAAARNVIRAHPLLAHLEDLVRRMPQDEPADSLTEAARVVSAFSRDEAALTAAKRLLSPAVQGALQ